MLRDRLSLVGARARRVRGMHRWLWRHRWPWFAFILCGILTAFLTFNPVADHGIFDKTLVSLLALGFLLLMFSVIVGTPRDEWDERPTGILLLALGDLALYGGLVWLRDVVGVQPFPDFMAAILRASLLFAAFLLIWAYGEVTWLRLRIWAYRLRIWWDEHRGHGKPGE